MHSSIDLGNCTRARDCVKICKTYSHDYISSDVALRAKNRDDPAIFVRQRPKTRSVGIRGSLRDSGDSVNQSEIAMLTFLASLLPVVASLYVQTAENYILDIYDNTLGNVRFINDPNPVLILSGMNLQAIEQHAFHRVPNVVNLDISNNSLTILPQFIFSKLNTLEILSLANNKIRQLNNLFANLRYLKLLDISRNPINRLVGGSLFGLPKSTRILIEGNNFRSISTEMCSNPQNKRLVTQISQVGGEDKIGTTSQDVEIYRLLKDTQLKLCKFNGIAMLLSDFWKIGKFPEGCVEVPIVFSKRQVDLRDQGIIGFRGNWYRPYNLPIVSVDLSFNRIAEMKEEMLDSLPANLIEFSASGNRITFIPNNIFSRLPNLSYLNLGENNIEILQNDVFQNLRSLKTLILANNVITTIEPAAFKDLTALKILDLEKNFIRDLQASTFAKLTALETLNLNWNEIDNVTFIDLPKNLDTLYVDFNDISAIEKGSFVGAPRITLSLLSNKISRIARGAFNIPTLEQLFLGMNSLTTFECDIYEGLGRLRELWLFHNEISEIRKGSCKNLKNLDILCISYNPLQKLEAGALYGFSTDAKGILFIMGNSLKEIQVGLFDDI